MKSIVTGSSGFIGSRLYSYLSKQGINVIGVSRKIKKDSQTDLICNLETDRLDDQAFAGVSSVFHLAGHAHDLSDPKKLRNSFIKLNIDATQNLATQSAKNGVKNFIFISTVKAGLADSGSINDMEDIDNFYGKTKRKAELELIKLSEAENMKISIVRPSLVYGKQIKGNLLLMKEAIQKGWFPPLPKIQNKRSMVHVDDLVKAILLVKKKGKNGEIYNVTDGKDYTTTEIYESFYEIIQKSPPKYRVPLLVLKVLQHTPGKAGHNISKLIGDENYSSSKIKSLGFEAKLRFKDLNETLF